MPLKLRCSECRGEIPYKGEWPDECPHCGVHMALKDDGVVEVPAFLSAKGKEGDKLYRAMEAGSELRVQQASELLGIPTSELSDLKITDMKDNTREGESAAMPVSNAVTQRMNEMQSRGVPTGFGTDGVQYSANVQSGPFPNAGAKMIDTLRDMHATSIDPRMAGKIQSDRPALELSMPGYRRRA